MAKTHLTNGDIQVLEDVSKFLAEAIEKNIPVGLYVNPTDPVAYLLQYPINTPTVYTRAQAMLTGRLSNRTVTLAEWNMLRQPLGKKDQAGGALITMRSIFKPLQWRRMENGQEILNYYNADRTPESFRHLTRPDPSGHVIKEWVDYLIPLVKGEHK